MKNQNMGFPQFSPPSKNVNHNSSSESDNIKISLFNGTEPAHMKYVDRIVDVNMKSIAQNITSSSWSPSIFKENSVNGIPKIQRSNENFLRADVFGIDIDGGCTLDHAKQILKKNNLQAIIGITRHHQKEKLSSSGRSIPACDRFRVILFLESPIYTAASYKEVFRQVKLLFPACDPACSDAARFYFPCKKVIFESEGDKFVVSDVRKASSSQIPKFSAEKTTLNTNKGQLSRKTLNFIACGAPDGSWHNELVAALFDLKEQCYSQDEAIVQIEKAAVSAHGKLDDTDLDQIKDIYENRIAKNPRREKKEQLSADEIAEKVKSNLSNVARMDTISEKPVEFVWSPYIAKGFVTLFTGDPGAGKSTITANIISIISRGGTFWDDEQSTKGNAVILTAEDPLEEVLKPRLTKAGVNAQNVFAFTQPLEFDDVGKQTIREMIKLYSPALLVIDPLVAYIGAGVDTSKANEVRAKMQFLSDLAKEFKLAILVIRHCAKGTGKENTPLIHRGHGSIDFVAAVRSEVMLICDPKNKNGRYFGHTKSNLTPLGNTLYFNMTDFGPALDRIEEKSLGELCEEETLKPEVNTAVDEVVSSIHEILTHGPAFKSDLSKELKDAGHTQATIRRGLEAVKNDVFSKRITFYGQAQGAGVWLMCNDKQAQALKDLKFEHLEQLRDWILNWKIQDAQNPFTPPPSSVVKSDRGEA